MCLNNLKDKLYRDMVCLRLLFMKRIVVILEKLEVYYGLMIYSVDFFFVGISWNRIDGDTRVRVGE